jgi:hypothetical protein
MNFLNRILEESQELKLKGVVTKVGNKSVWPGINDLETAAPLCSAGSEVLVAGFAFLAYFQTNQAICQGRTQWTVAGSCCLAPGISCLLLQSYETSGLWCKGSLAVSICHYFHM